MSLKKGMLHWIKRMGFERGNSRAVGGYGVAREHGTTKSDEGGVRRAELARATPRSNPKSGETKRRVFGVFVVLTTLVSFLPCPLPFIANLSPERRVGLAKCWRLRRAGFD